MSSSVRTTPRFKTPVLLSIAFRPFFLLAGLFATIGVPLWLHIYSGGLGYSGHLGGSLWHGHEMVFGFATAVFTGFLLTAAQNWTGRTTAADLPLGALVLLWIAGRGLLLASGETQPWPSVVADSLFLPAVAAVLLRPIWLARNRRNLLFPVGLLALAAINLGVHLSAMGLLDWDPSRLLRLALGLMALMMVIMGGRVIPFFTRNVLPRAGVASWNAVDIAAIASTAAIVPLELVVRDGGLLLGVVALSAGVINLVRMVPWRGWAAWRQPILVILHLGYLWLPIAFLLRGAAALDWLPVDAATHALGAGAIGTLTLGMMSRVALGHSGRAIAAAPLTVIAYGLVLLAGATRVASAFDGDALLHVSAACWVLGWALFVIVYTPVCFGGRAVGRPC